MAKKRQNEISIAEAIRYFIKDHGMEERVLQSMAIDAWHEQMGEFMKKYTQEIYVKNQILFVRISSSAIKNELSYGKSKILAHINQYLEKDYIKEVRFL